MILRGFFFCIHITLSYTVHTFSFEGQTASKGVEEIAAGGDQPRGEIL